MKYDKKNSNLKEEELKDVAGGKQNPEFEYVGGHLYSEIPSPSFADPKWTSAKVRKSES